MSNPTQGTGFNAWSAAHPDHRDVAPPPAAAPAERPAINFAEKLVTIDDEPARFVAASGVESFPNLVAYGAVGSEEFVPVNGFGDSAEANGFILNFVEPEEPSEDDKPLSVEAVKCGVIVLPRSLRLRVRHVKRGPGTVIKVREDAEGKRNLFVESDNPRAGQDRGYWALNSKLRDIATY